MRIICSLAALIACLLALRVDCVRAATRDSFETSETTWRIQQRDCALATDTHRRVYDKARSGQVSEHIRFRCGRGTKIYLTHPIEPARVIDELAPSVWVNSERPGVQILVRVVLPRSVDPQNGGPMSTILPGPSYQNVGSWQQLRMSELTRRLQREVRFLRTRFGPEVDIREAYVDLVVLNVYCCPGANSIWIDDLEIEGHVSTNRSTPPHSDSISKDVHSDERPNMRHVVRVKGTILEIAGRPTFLTIIDYNGEQLDGLKSLGFNTIKLDCLPTSELHERAKRHGMWIVSPPPPTSDEISGSGAFDRIVVWNVTQHEMARDVGSMRGIAHKTQLLPDELQRPIVCDFLHDGIALSRWADVLSFAPWIAEAPFESRSTTEQPNRKVRPIKPFWVSVPTEAFHSSDSGPQRVDPLEVREMALLAIAAGARGLAFRSSSPLDVPDPETKIRAETLRLLNAELKVLAPWAAGAAIGTKQPTTDPDVEVSVLQTERSRLLIIHRKRNLQTSSAVLQGSRKVSFLDEGASNSSRVYEVEPLLGLRPIKHERKPSGIHITVDKVSSSRILVVTHDPLVLEHIRHQSFRVTQRNRE